jgi:hypothetical protein
VAAAFSESQQPLAIQQRNALNTGGLRAAARITGSYVSLERGPEGVIRNLDVIAKPSPVIILGTIQPGGTTHVGGTGKFVTTEYDVKVAESLKGDLKPGDVVAVDLRGGQVTFEDGTWARTEWLSFSFTHPAPGHTAVFFLGPLSANEKPHQDRADAKGQPKRVYGVTSTYYVFELGKTVIPAAVWPNDATADCRQDSPLVIWARCQSPDQFLTELREAIKRAG